MSSDEFQVQNLYRYSRKSYKKCRRGADEADSPREEDIAVDSSPRTRQGSRTDMLSTENAACSCELDPEGEIASILHKKCPVISLAQQQLQRLLDGTDRLMCENTRCCRSLFEFFCMCKELLVSPNKCQYILLMLMVLAFFIGILFGAASCGTTLRQFNSPILHCIDSYFITDSYTNVAYRGIS